MKTREFNQFYWQLGLAGFLAIGGAIASSFERATAQITPDNTLGAESSVVTPNVDINGTPSDQIGGGAIRGANLFHSFGEFNINEGRGAYFTNPNGIENILSRVTGGNPSNIFGKLGVLGNANLFLINPRGIIFGSNASLDLGGSFVASTASSLNFADGTAFSATAPTITPLLTVSAPVGLQYGGNIGSILNQSQATNSGGEIVGLQVQRGRNLALLGGNVSLDGGILQAPGGKVELGGLAQAGTVGLNFDGSNLQLSFPDTVQRADVSLTNGSQVNVRAGGGGSIAINAQNLNLAEGSFLRAGIELGLGSVDSRAGDIQIATRATNLSNNSIISNVVRTNALGNGGNINITTDSLSVTNGSQLATGTFGRGNAGSVNIFARDSASFTGVGSNALSSAALTRVGSEAVGRGGDINIISNSLLVTDGAQLLANTFGQGNAGTVNINVRDTVSFAGIGSNGFSSAAISAVEAEAVGRGGDVNITSGSLFVTNGAQLVADTFGQGDAGNVNINVRDTVSFSEESAALTRVEAEAVGQGGDINITSGSLFVTDGSQLIANTQGQGNAGNVNINTRDTVSFARVSSNGFSSAAFSRVEAEAVGRGGDINITAGSLSVTDGSQLLASTYGQGDAGNVNINTRDTVSFAKVGSNGLSSGVFTSTEFGARGRGGEIKVNTTALRVQDGSVVSSRTLNSSDGGSVNINAATFEATNGGQVLTTARSSGRAGNITLNVSDRVTLSGSDPTYAQRLAEFGKDDLANESATSGLFANTSENSSGQGGDLRIATKQLTVRDGAKVTVSSEGTGSAGNLEVTARSIHLDNNGSLTATTRSGNGGDITLQVQDLLSMRRNSQISSTAGTAQAGGDGGNINIDAGLIAALENSDITANAFEGRGGNVQIGTQGLFLSPDSQITASSEQGIDGIVEIITPDVELQNSLTQLAANFASPDSVVAGSCLARRNVERGSFTVTGTGGLPASPYEAIGSRYEVVNIQPIGADSQAFKPKAIVVTAPWKRGEPIREAQGMTVTADGRTIVGTTLQIATIVKSQNSNCPSE